MGESSAARSGKLGPILPAPGESPQNNPLQIAMSEIITTREEALIWLTIHGRAVPSHFTPEGRIQTARRARNCVVADAKQAGQPPAKERIWPFLCALSAQSSAGPKRKRVRSQDNQD
jgi:hypothetical protein